MLNSSPCRRKIPYEFYLFIFCKFPEYLSLENDHSNSLFSMFREKNIVEVLAK